jgi:hypothetical protein
MIEASNRGNIPDIGVDDDDDDDDSLEKLKKRIMGVEDENSKGETESRQATSYLLIFIPHKRPRLLAVVLMDCQYLL